MFYRLLLIIWLIFCPAISSPVWSYVGPGAGITLLSSFWVFLSFFGVLVVGMLVWPIRILFRRLKSFRRNRQAEPDADDR
jgi:hypothetical protein